MKKAKSLLPCYLFFGIAFPFSFLFFSVFQVYAVTVSLSDIPSSISSDPFTVKVTISGASTATNYLRVDLYKEGTTNYFGETHNTSTWYNGSDGKQYYPVTIVSGADWSGSIQARVGSPSTSDYDGSGSYRLRVRRYTGSGNSANDGDNSTAITIVFPTNTPIPTNTPTPTNVPTPTKTPTPQNTPTPTKSSSPTPTPTKVSTSLTSSTSTPTVEVTAKLSPTKVLGSSTKSAILNLPTATPIKKPSPTVKVQGVKTEQDFLPLFFIGGGMLLLISCGILTFQPQLKKLWKKE